MKNPAFPSISLLVLLATPQLAPAQSPPDSGNMLAAPSPAAETEADDALDEAISSTEQGQTPLTETFGHDPRQRRLEQRADAIRATRFDIHPRAYYLGRDKADGSESESLALGGWAGLKTGYFLDRVAIGLTGYTSQHLGGDEADDGALLLAAGQEGYSVLGELYADIRIMDDMNLYIGRKEFDTPFINRNDTRMTPNTFEAVALQGKVKTGGKDGTLRYGLAYFDKIKERNSDEFVSMASDAGAETDRGVFTAGALYQQGDFSIGAINYHSPDVINIAYAEAKMTVPLSADLNPSFSAQFTDQRSTGDDLLTGESFSTQQIGVKAELPVGPALFTTAFTHNTDGADIRNPWSGYPGYTGAQVEDFNRAGENAFLLRAGYDLPWLDGLSAYALWVHGLDPEASGAFAKDEYDLNLQWSPRSGVMKGFSVRLRYALVDQRGGDADLVDDFRMICNYALTF